MRIRAGGDQQMVVPTATANYRVYCTELTIFLVRIEALFDSYEAQEAYSQTGASCPLPDLWRGVRREVRTQSGTAPYRAAS